MSIKFLTIKLFFGIVLFTVFVHCQKPWTQSYSQKYSISSHVSDFVFSKKALQPFSQIIISWNAQRPNQGSYEFFIRVHDKKTQVWRAWHTCAQWGDSLQKTVYSAPVGFGDTSENCYVRFEAHDFADGFQVRVEKNCASAHRVEDKNEGEFYLHVCCSSLEDLQAEEAENIEGLQSLRIVGVPAYSQMALGHKDFGSLCMPTALSMAAQFVSGRALDSVACAQVCYDTGLRQYGSWPFCAAAVYEKTGGSVICRVQRLHDFKSLYNFLERGFPVVVSIRGSNIPGAFKAYKHGHALVVIGFDSHNNRVLCHDPAFLCIKDVVTSYSLRDFLRAWESSGRLSFIFNQA